MAESRTCDYLFAPAQVILKKGSIFKHFLDKDKFLALEWQMTYLEKGVFLRYIRIVGNRSFWR